MGETKFFHSMYCQRVERGVTVFRMKDGMRVKVGQGKEEGRDASVQGGKECHGQGRIHSR